MPIFSSLPKMPGRRAGVDEYQLSLPKGLVEPGEDILAAADRSGGEVYMAFLRGGQLHVAVQTGRDFFELGKGAADVGQLRQKFLGELRWFTDIVDTLCREETNV